MNACEVSFFINVVFVIIYLAIQYMKGRQKQYDKIDHTVEVKLADDGEGNELYYKGKKSKIKEMSKYGRN